jgi:predicted nicotinamide N-methyase
VQRAQDLADVALRVYDSGAKAVRVPLASNHPLVVVIRECLSSGSGSSAKQAAAVLAGAQEVAEALLELIIQAQVGLKPVTT